MAQSIEYQKLMTEMVHINLPGPEEPDPSMSGGELLHGFLADLYHAGEKDAKGYLEAVCMKWNVRYRTVRN
jgi:hypothetical protein